MNSSNCIVAESDMRTVTHVLRRIERKYGRLTPRLVCEEARANEVLAKYFPTHPDDENQARKIIQSVQVNTPLSSFYYVP